MSRPVEADLSGNLATNQDRLEDRERDRYRSIVTARFENSMTVSESFFKAEAGRIALACREMAQRFHKRGRLLAFGAGSSASDAQHVAVEFVHPVTVGKPAFPGLALEAEISAEAYPVDPQKHQIGWALAHRLGVLARPQDIAIGFSTGLVGDHYLVEALKVAHQKGLLTLVFTGGQSELSSIQNNYIDFCFVVEATDPWLIQETHRTLYHILWELVHLYYEHEGLGQPTEK